MATFEPLKVRCPKEPHTSKGAYLLFAITNVTQTDGTLNQTTIQWQVTIQGTSWVTLHGRYLKVNDKELVPLNTTLVSEWATGKVVNSGTTTFDNNADGSISLQVFLKQLFNYYYSSARWNSTSYSQSVSATLVGTTIPRYPILNMDTSTTTLNTATATFSNTRVGDISQYQLALVSDETILQDNTATGTFTINLTGLTPNTEYGGVYKVRAYANGGWGDWYTITSLKTKALPTVTATPTADIGASITLTLSSMNYLSSWSVTTRSTTGATTIRTVSGLTGTTNTQTLTESQKATLLSKYPNTTNASVTYTVTVISNGISYTITNTLQTIYTVPNAQTYAPTFTSAQVANVVDTKNVAITGSNTKFIKGHNTLTGTISPMTPKYSATGSTYYISTGADNQTTLPYSSSAQSFTLSNVTANVLTVTANDSRSLSTTITKALTIIEYEKPTFNTLQLTRQDGIGSYAILNASGKYTNWSGLSQTNSVATIQYRWKLATGAESTYSAWTSGGTVVNSNGDWSISATLPTSFSTTLQYHIQVRITDKLETVVGATQLLSTANVFIWKDLLNKRMGINVKPTTTLDVGTGSIGTKELWINGVKTLWEE